MRRSLLLLLVVSVVFVFSSSVAVADDCPDSKYDCQVQDSTSGKRHTIGHVTVATKTKATIFGIYCHVIGGDKAPAERCNSLYPDKCSGSCIACITNPNDATFDYDGCKDSHGHNK